MRRPRFSLATMCVIVLVGCGLLGWLRWRIVADATERKAIRHLLQRGHLLSKEEFDLNQGRYLDAEGMLIGWVPASQADEFRHLLWQGKAAVAVSRMLPPVSADWYHACKRALIGRRARPRTLRVTQEFTDEDAAYLRDLSSLRTLAVDHQRVGDSFNACLASLTELRCLSMVRTQFTGDTVKTISQLSSLESLWLDHAPVEDEGAGLLRKLEGLRELSLNGTQVTDAALDDLSSINGLQLLRLDSAEVTNAGLAELQDLVEIKTLSLNNTAITVEGLRYLSKMTKLESLRIDICNIRIGDAVRVLGIEQNRGVRESLTMLGVLQQKDGRLVLNLGGWPVNDGDLWFLDRVPDVETLHLGGDQISDSGVQRVMELKKLTRLQFSSPHITDAAVDDLAEARQLNHLFVVGTAISSQGIKRLRDEHPTCNVLKSN